MSNLRLYGNTDPANEIHRYGGILEAKFASSELAIDRINRTYLLDGSGTVVRLASRPVGVVVRLYCLGAPTFTYSTALLLPGSASRTFQAGDTLELISLGDGAWRLFNVAPAQGNVRSVTPQGRLTLTSGVAITTSDVTGATMIYYTPATGDLISLVGVPTSFSELSNDSTASSVGKAGPAAVANNSIYDFLVWSDAGTNRLTRSPAWASDTSRGTGAGTAEIEIVNGEWVNKYDVTNGPLAHQGRLVGSARSNGSAQFTDSVLFRWVSNAYNTVPRLIRIVEPANSWNYTTATWRQANANGANSFDMLQTLGGNLLSANILVTYSNTNVGEYGIVAIGLDSITVPTVGNLNPFMQVPGATAVALAAYLKAYPGIGRHYAAWLEYSSAGGGTGTFYGDAGGTLIQSGMQGEIAN